MGLIKAPQVYKAYWIELANLRYLEYCIVSFYCSMSFLLNNAKSLEFEILWNLAMTQKNEFKFLESCLWLKNSKTSQCKRFYTKSFYLIIDLESILKFCKYVIVSIDYKHWFEWLPMALDPFPLIWSDSSEKVKDTRDCNKQVRFLSFNWKAIFHVMIKFNLI